MRSPKFCSTPPACLPPVSVLNGKLANLRNLTDPTTTIGAPYYSNPTLKDFAPRVGFAWDPFKDGRTAVRGGFGVFDIVPLPFLFQARVTRAPPFFQAGQLNSPPSSSFPNQVFQLLTPSTLGGVHVEFNPSRDYRMQWNLNIQRQLTRSLALTVGYVGSAGVHLAHISQDTDQVPASLVTFNSALDAFVFPIPAAGAKIQRINPNFGKIAYQPVAETYVFKNEFGRGDALASVNGCEGNRPNQRQTARHRS